MTYRPPKTREALQAECDAFNFDCKPGGRVAVKIDGTTKPLITKTRSDAQIMGGHSAVVWLEGVSGSYLLGHVTPIPDAVPTVTLSGHQLHMALDLINPDGPADRDQLDEELTFGVVQHKDDDGKAATSMCCWNGDTDGVLPLDGEYTAAPANQPVIGKLMDAFSALPALFPDGCQEPGALVRQGDVFKLLAAAGKAEALLLSDAEFLSKRLGRVAKLAGVSMPDDMTHAQIAHVAGTILGDIARAMELTAWTTTPPTAQGEYWHWNGDPDSAPIVFNILYSGTAKKCFVPINQSYTGQAIMCDVYGGYWLRIERPALPA